MTIEEQLAACKAATPGPWDIHPPHNIGANSLRIFAGTDLIAYVGNSDETTVQLKSNAKLISDARTNYPAALRAMKKLVELYREDEYNEELQAMYDIIDAFERGEFNE